jgi:hypothetical protein
MMSRGGAHCCGGGGDVIDAINLLLPADLEHLGRLLGAPAATTAGAVRALCDNNPAAVEIVRLFLFSEARSRTPPRQTRKRPPETPPPVVRVRRAGGGGAGAAFVTPCRPLRFDS